MSFSKDKKIKVLKIFFLTLMGIGLLFLIFPLYTNLVASRQGSNALYEWELLLKSSKFSENSEINEHTKEDADKVNSKTPESTEDSTTVSTGGVTEDFLKSSKIAETLVVEDTFPLKMEIPKIGLEWIVNDGTDRQILKKGPGHYTGTKLPGQVGRCAIAGHRTTYGAPFNKIDLLESGDLIYLETLKGFLFTYAVSETIVVKPIDVYVLNGGNKSELVLTTCEPEFSAAKRLIVIAELVEIIPLEMKLDL